MNLKTVMKKLENKRSASSKQKTSVDKRLAGALSYKPAAKKKPGNRV